TERKTVTLRRSWGEFASISLYEQGSFRIRRCAGSAGGVSADIPSAGASPWEGNKEEESMRKAFLLSAVAGAALFASTAMADVFVYGTVDKTTVIDIDEIVLTARTLSIEVTITDEADAAAEGTTVFNQRN